MQNKLDKHKTVSVVLGVETDTGRCTMQMVFCFFSLSKEKIIIFDSGANAFWHSKTHTVTAHFARKKERLSDSVKKMWRKLAAIYIYMMNAMLHANTNVCKNKRNEKWQVTADSISLSHTHISWFITLPFRSVLLRQKKNKSRTIHVAFGTHPNPKAISENSDPHIKRGENWCIKSLSLCTRVST